MSSIPTKEEIQKVYDNIARSRVAKARLDGILLNPRVDSQSKASIRFDLRQYYRLRSKTNRAVDGLREDRRWRKLRNGRGTIEDWDACRRKYWKLQDCENDLISLLHVCLGTVGLSWWHF
ncbi:hypothetical protein Hte_007106 [Hypoxylon texense]